MGRLAPWHEHVLALDPRHPVRLAYDAAPPRRADDIAQAVCYLTTRIAGPALAGRPSPRIAAYLILGLPPQYHAPDLTRAEADAWARQSEHDDPAEWLWSHVLKEHGLAGATGPRDIAVVRWVAACLLDPERRDALTRDRAAVFGGGPAEGSVLSRIDEITAADLRPSPRETIERAVARIALAAWAGPDLLREPTRYERAVPAGVVCLLTASGLAMEGLDLRHCVAQYCETVARGATILGIAAASGARSTCLIEQGRIVQHRGPRNSDPAAECVSLAEAALAAMRVWD